MNRRLTAIFAIVVAAAPLGAQLTPADSARLRAEIATALLEFEWNYTRPLPIRIGQTSASIPDSLVPPAFRILGGTTDFVILETSSALNEARRLVNEHLLARGIRVNEPWYPREEGFVFGSRSRGASGRPVTEYCFGQDLLTVTARPKFAETGAGSMIQYRLRGDYQSCAPNFMPPERVLDIEQPTLEMPILRPPPGATSNGSGMSGGGSSGSYQRIARAEVRSEMTTHDIIHFYAAQLTEQGWTVAQPAIVTEAAIVSARKTDKEGRQLQGALADVRSSQGTHYMTFQIDRAPGPRGRRP